MTKILLVEDDKSLREIYGVRLLAEGYDIVSAGDGEEALAMAIKERPDMIVSDVMMPKISGFDMLDILRSTTETRNIKVIMMTALSSEDQRTRGEQLGADKYLVKSQVGIEDVVRTVHEVLGDQANAPVAPAPQAAPLTQATAAEETPEEAADAMASVENELRASAPEIQPTDMPVPLGEPVGVVTPPSPAAVATAPATDPTLVSEPTPAASTLPQPTAPFSSPRPSTLGERVIHPLESAQPTTSSTVSSQIEQELKAAVEPVSEPTPTVAPEAPQTFDAPTEPQLADSQAAPAPFSHDYHQPRVNDSARPTTAPTDVTTPEVDTPAAEATPTSDTPQAAQPETFDTYEETPRPPQENQPSSPVA